LSAQKLEGKGIFKGIIRAAHLQAETTILFKIYLPYLLKIKLSREYFCVCKNVRERDVVMPLENYEIKEEI